MPSFPEKIQNAYETLKARHKSGAGLTRHQSAVAPVLLGLVNGAADGEIPQKFQDYLNALTAVFLLSPDELSQNQLKLMAALAQLDDTDLDGYTEVFLYSTQRLMSHIAMPNIRVGDELWVKLCTLDQDAYDYWRDFEVMLYANTFNMDFGVDTKGNVQGGLGYWVGYGVDKEVCIELKEPEQRN